MSKKIIFLSLLLSFASLWGCTSKEEATAKAGKALPIQADDYRGSADYRVDMGASIIEWSGQEVVSGKTHRGTLKLNQGKFYIKKGRLTGGSFEIDMESLTVKDLKTGNGKEKLEKHLRSDDFFSIDRHPKASFAIAEVYQVDTIPNANAIVSGNLTLKGITKSISLPAKIGINDRFVTVITPEFSINRTEWEVMFRSGLLGTAKDKVISDLITLRLRVKGDNPENTKPSEPASEELSE